MEDRGGKISGLFFSLDSRQNLELGELLGMHWEQNIHAVQRHSLYKHLTSLATLCCDILACYYCPCARITAAKVGCISVKATIVFIKMAEWLRTPAQQFCGHRVWGPGFKSRWHQLYFLL